MDLINISQNEYNQFRNEYKECNFWQSSQMCELKKSQGWKIHYLGLKDNDKLVASTALVSMPVLSKYSLFMALRGFMIDYDNLELVDTFLTKLKEYLHIHNCLYMKTDPYVEYQKHDKNGDEIEGTKRDKLVELFKKHDFEHKGFRTELDMNYEPRWMQILDLTDKSEEQLLKAMSSNARRNIQNLIKSGVKTRFLKDNEFDKIANYVNNTGSNKGFHGPNEAYYKKFYNAFNGDMKIMYSYLDTNNYIEFIRKKNDEDKLNKAYQLKETYGDEMPLGAAMFVETNYEIVFVFGGSNETPVRFHEGYALQWSMIQYALEKGINRYNFYGISGNFSKDAEDYGVYNFKKGFNSEVVELVGDFEYVDRSFLYKTYNLLRGIKNKLRG